MRLLLEENLPKQLKSDFQEYEIYTVRDMGWNGVKNGELLKLLQNHNFDAFLTFDKNLQQQQNFSNYTIKVFVLSARINKYKELTILSPQVKVYLNNQPGIVGPIVIKTDTLE
jgi:hypothetical protein